MSIVSVGLIVMTISAFVLGLVIPSGKRLQWRVEKKSQQELEAMATARKRTGTIGVIVALLLTALSGFVIPAVSHDVVTLEFVEFMLLAIVMAAAVTAVIAFRQASTFRKMIRNLENK